MVWNTNYTFISDNIKQSDKLIQNAPFIQASNSSKDISHHEHTVCVETMFPTLFVTVLHFWPTKQKSYWTAVNIMKYNNAFLNFVTFLSDAVCSIVHRTSLFHQNVFYWNIICYLNPLLPPLELVFVLVWVCIWWLFICCAEWCFVWCVACVWACWRWWLLWKSLPNPMSSKNPAGIVERKLSKHSHLFCVFWMVIGPRHQCMINWS